jgi:drug/metabolite transporter (DMT)-like permease
MTGSYNAGLGFATALAISNVVMDVLRKKSLEPNDLYSVSFWLRAVSTVCFAVVLGLEVFRHGLPVLHSAGPLFGIAGAELPASAQFIVYLLLDTAMVALAILFYLRALQTSELSYFLPFMSLTPVLLLPTGFLLIGEIPKPHQIAGVLLIVAGSLAMNAQHLNQGVLRVLSAPFEKEASRNALWAALLFALSNPVDKIVVGMSHPVVYAFGYSLALTGFFGALMFFKGRVRRPPIPGTWHWVAAAGAVDALALLLQFNAYRYLDVTLVIAIKRGGVILSVLAGWLVFRESKIADKLFATAIMAGGMLLIYLPASRLEDTLLTIAGLAAFGLRVWWQRRGVPETISRA